MAPDYVAVPSRDSGGQKPASRAAHMATTTLSIEGMT